MGFNRDKTQLGKANELTLAKSGRVCVQLSLSAIQLALSHAKPVASNTMDCFLIATSWIDKGELVLVLGSHTHSLTRKTLALSLE